MEHGAATNSERIGALEYCHRLGIRTFASIEPVIDFNLSYQMIAKTIGNCDIYKIGLQSGVSKGTYTRVSVCSFVDRVCSIVMAHAEAKVKNLLERVYQKVSSRRLRLSQTGFLCRLKSFNIFKGK